MALQWFGEVYRQLIHSGTQMAKMTEITLTCTNHDTFHTGKVFIVSSKALHFAPMIYLDSPKAIALTTSHLINAFADIKKSPNIYFPLVILDYRPSCHLQLVPVSHLLRVVQ